MALIIRPNGGINNAVAGLAAGFGQGMQLGMESQKIQLAREKQEAELRFAEQRAALELAAEERAKTTFGQQQELFDQAQAERAAGKEAMGLLGQAADLRGQIQGGVANMPGVPAELQYQGQGGPQQSNMYTGAPHNPYAAFNNMMGGLIKKGQYAGVQQNYEKAMQQAGALAGKMNPEMADRYLKEVERRQLLAADDQARQAFASNIADIQARGGFAVLDPAGNPVQDPQMEATLRSLVQQADNRNVPVQQLQAQVDTILGKVNANNTRARTTQFELGTIDQSIATAMQANNGGAVAALQAARGEFTSNPLLTPQEKSELLSNAQNGLVPVLIGDKKKWVSATNKETEVKQLQEEYDAVKKLTQRAMEAEALAKEKDAALKEAQAGYYGRRDTGMTVEDAQRNAIRLLHDLSEDERDQLQQQGITAEQYVNRVTQNFLSQGGNAGQRGAAAMGQATGQVPQYPPLPGQRKVTIGGKDYVVTDEIVNGLQREADAIGLPKGDARREYAQWRFQNQQADPNDFSKVVNNKPPFTPKDGEADTATPSSKPPQPLGFGNLPPLVTPKAAQALTRSPENPNVPMIERINALDEEDKQLQQLLQKDKDSWRSMQPLTQQERVTLSNLAANAQSRKEEKERLQQQIETRRRAPALAAMEKKMAEFDAKLNQNGPPMPITELRQNQKEMEAEFAKYAKRVSGMSERQLKDEIVASWGFDVRDILETMKVMGFDDTKYTLADIAAAGPKLMMADKTLQNNLSSRPMAQYKDLKTAEGQPFRGEEVPASLRPLHAVWQQVKYKQQVQARTTTLPPRAK